ADEQLSHSARYALESMPSPQAGAALVHALETTSGLTRVGIINSIAVRREAQAVAALAKLLPPGRGDSAPRDDASISAAAALGEIAPSATLPVLESALARSSGALHSAVVDAILRCADRLLASGREGDALRAFRRIYAAETNAPMRI